MKKLIALLLLAGCATVSPENVNRVSVQDLCRTWGHGNTAPYILDEIKRRGADCSAVEAGRMQAGAILLLGQ